MTIAAWIEVIGSVAGLCTTFAFVPQVLKIWKQGGRDLSYSMLGLYLTGVLLWLSYGVLLHAWAIIGANAATAVLIVMATGLKAWKEKQAALKVSLPDQTAERS
jgi:MtN3 and saliva related transmembrane protein